MKMPNKHSAPKGRASLRMELGGMVPGVPTGAGMDRAGMLARNPALAANQTASPSPGNIASQTALSGAQAAAAAAPGGMAAHSTPAMEEAAGQAHRKNLADFERQSKFFSDWTKENNAGGPGAAAAPIGASGLRDSMLSSLLGRRVTAPLQPQASAPQYGSTAFMKHGGPVMPQAEHGGEVPGQGRGDKVHALLEPEERVVSNAMLKDNPGLGEALDGLREQALARRGMTVEEANAQSRKGGTLRAVLGKDGYETPPVRGVGGIPQMPGASVEPLPFTNVRPGDLDMTRVPAGSQPMPAASVTADAIKLNRLRDAANTASSAPAAVTVPPVRPDPADVLRRLNQPGIDLRNAAYATHVDGALPPHVNPFEAGARDAQILKARATPWVPGTPSGAEPKVTPAAAAPVTPAPAPAVTAAPVAPGKGTLAAATPSTAAGDVSGANGVAKAVRTTKGSLRGAADYVKNIPGQVSANAKALDQSMLAALDKLPSNAVPAAATALSLAPGQLRVGEVLADPSASGMTKVSNVVQQQGDELARASSQAAGGTIGYGLGMLTAPVTTAAAPLVGAALSIPGAYLGGKAYDMFKTGVSQATGTDLRTPHETLKARQAAADVDARFKTLPQASFSNEGRNPGPSGAAGVGYGPRADVADKTDELNKVPKKLPEGLRDGVVYKTIDPKTGRVTYSGRNVGVNSDGETEMVDGQGKRLKMLNGLRDDASSLQVLGKNGKPVGGTAVMDGKSGNSMLGDGTAVNPKTRASGGGDVSQALRAAAERGDVDALRDYYGQKGQTFLGQGPSKGGAGGVDDELERVKELAFSAPGTIGRRGAQTLYAQLLQNRTHMAQVDATRENNQLLREQNMIPYRTTQANREAIARAQEIVRSKGGSDEDVHRILLQSGMPEAAKTWSDAISGSEERKAKQAKQMSEQFKGQFIDLTTGKADENAEALAARVHAQLNNGEIVSADKSMDTRKQAILHTKAILAMQRYAKQRNEGVGSWWSGKENMPTVIDGSAAPKKTGMLSGAFTGHDFVHGDFNYGDQELPGDVGQDVIDYLTKYNKAYQANEKKKGK